MTPPSEPAYDPRRWAALIVTLSATLMDLIDATVVSAAPPIFLLSVSRTPKPCGHAGWTEYPDPPGEVRMRSASRQHRFSSSLAAALVVVVGMVALTPPAAAAGGPDPVPELRREAISCAAPRRPVIWVTFARSAGL
ncbi:hypothetical protein ACFQYP_49110 [Nonomuraea antimicrobica]